MGHGVRERTICLPAECRDVSGDETGKGTDSFIIPFVLAFQAYGPDLE